MKEVQNELIPVYCRDHQSKNTIIKPNNSLIKENYESEKHRAYWNYLLNKEKEVNKMDEKTKKIITILENEIEKSKKILKESGECKDYSRMVEMDSYKRGLEFSLVIVKLA